MNTWNMKNSSGISVGGQFYASDENGSVTVPDGVGDLSVYGFDLVVSRADAKEQSKIEAAATAGVAESEAANAAVSADVTAATMVAESQPETNVDAAVAASAMANSPISAEVLQ